MPQNVTIERPSYRFTVPEQARQFPTDPKSFSMRPITANEERRANEVAEGAKTPLAYELLRQAVHEIDGQAVDWNTSGPEWVERCGPKVRQLAFEAFARVNRPDESDTNAFLASMTMSVSG
jgi:hypothetical protein